MGPSAPVSASSQIVLAFLGMLLRVGDDCTSLVLAIAGRRQVRSAWAIEILPSTIR